MGSRKILCPSCGSILNEDILKQKNSQETCLVCGASLCDEPESIPGEEEELITWYYYEFKNGSGYLDDKYIEDNEKRYLVYTFKAPPEDENGDFEAAKEILRQKFPDAFNGSTKKEKPDPVRCPRCGCTNIQIIPRKWSIWTGYRTNAVSRICVNCRNKF